jgi:hypothetical protein
LKTSKLSKRSALVDFLRSNLPPEPNSPVSLAPPSLFVFSGATNHFIGGRKRDLPSLVAFSSRASFPSVCHPQHLFVERRECVGRLSNSCRFLLPFFADSRELNQVE